MDFSVFKKLFQSEPKRMGGVIIHYLTPLPAVSYCYEMQRIAEKKKITGRIFLNMNGTLKLQLEGELSKLREFHELLSNQKIVPTRMEIETMWVPYKKLYECLLVNCYHQIMSSARMSGPNPNAHGSWRS